MIECLYCSMFQVFCVFRCMAMNAQGTLSKSEMRMFWFNSEMVMSNEDICDKVATDSFSISSICSVFIWVYSCSVCGS